MFLPHLSQLGVGWQSIFKDVRGSSVIEKVNEPTLGSGYSGSHLTHIKLRRYSEVSNTV